MKHGKTSVTRAQFEANLAEKILDPAFIEDVQPLLAPDTPHFDVKAAAENVKSAFLTLLPGDPWKDPAQKRDRRKP